MTQVKKAPVTFTLTVEDEDGKEYSCQLSKPSRQIIGQATGMMMPVNGQVPDISRAGEWILQNCWIEGDEIIKEDDDLLFAACMQCMEMVKMKTTTLKKN